VTRKYATNLIRRNTKVKFEYAVITQADILKGLHPTDEELKAFYERNKATYNNTIPEKRKVEYVVIDSSKLAANTTVTDPDLQTYYDQHREEFRVPDQVKVSPHSDQDSFSCTPGAKEDEKGYR
jgi:peptidyl-prolyl cis-trans isomerase D